MEWLLAVLVGSVFIAESLTMIFLSRLPAISGMTEILLDASTLSILLFPLFYFLIFRPLTRNIVELEQAEDKLRLAASVFTHAREGIIITDTSGAIIDVNETFSKITGYSRAEALGQNPRMLKSGRQDPEVYAAMWKSLAEKGHWYGEIWNRRKDGEVYAEMLTISVVKNTDGESQHYVALFTDISPMKEHQQQLEHIAHYDALTNLPNRVLLADRLSQAISQSQRRDQPLALAYLDLDGFKTINDFYGHNVGDELLIAIAQRMKAVLRDGDTLARIGGDEFVAVLIDLYLPQDYELVLSRLLQAVAAPVNLNEMVLQVSASIGVTLYPQDGADADQLMRHADQAMYQAKQAGKNRYHLFDVAQDAVIQSRHENLEEIRHALDQRQFVLYYQPQVNMYTGEVIGAEALIRWQHPERGLLAPAEFLPIIESHPISVELGEWVIDTALSQLAEWHLAGIDIPISVNVGARQLQHGNFVANLAKQLAAHSTVLPGNLKLEVLETSALEDMAYVSEVMRACGEMGVRFALDDFGTGYSSLIYLKRLPVDMLKIDQTFVRNMLEDPEDMAIIDGVLGLASAFHHRVIAEGVETIGHGELLLSLGCQLAQGYAIARPMPAAEFPDWQVNWRTDPYWATWRERSISRENLPVLFAEVMHRQWLSALESFLADERQSPPPLDAHGCRLGRWLDTEGRSRYGHDPLFHKILDCHEHVHSLCGKLVDLHGMGRKNEALARVYELHALRDELIASLNGLLGTLTGFVRLLWHDNYRSGHPLIDRQHQGLFDKANELLAAVIDGRPSNAAAGLIKELLADVVTHFADEEQVLRAIDFPGVAEHEGRHRALVEKAQRLAAQFAEGSLALGDLFSFLAYDLVAIHMLAEDRMFFPYIQTD